MHKRVFIALFIGMAVLLSGCGEPYRKEADMYVDAAKIALIAKGVCSNNADCNSKEILFWNDGEYFLDILPKDVTYVFLYNTHDPEVVNAVVAELKKVQEKISKPGVVLNVYKSKHLEQKVKFKRVIIQ